MPYLGSHMSVAGGVHLAVERAKKVDAKSLQIFSKNSNQWKAKPLSKDEIEKFRSWRKEWSIEYAFAHDSYLINLASPKDTLRRQSIDAFLDEMDRAEALGLDFIVFHPGAHMGEGVEAGCQRVASALNVVLKARPKNPVKLLIENAAGQGTTLGRGFEELALIRNDVVEKKRTGFCFDTCHAFAAGYDLRTPEGYQKTMNEFDRVAGAKNILAFHINDSKKGLDCRVDRHEHIGKGEIGVEAFRCLLNDPRFADRPMVLETPKSDDLHEDLENLGVLRTLISKT